MAARERLSDVAAAANRDAAHILERPKVRALVAAISDHSPYLWRLIESDVARFLCVLGDDPARRLDAILAALRSGWDATEPDVMRRLREAKQEVALLVALADLGGVWSLEDVIQALSTAADALIGVALGYVLRGAAAQGKLRLPDRERPEDGCGIVVLGLGKLGGRELNYSSDVDLVVIFDPASAAIVKPDEAKTLFVRLVRDLVRLLQQPTDRGFVLRVDLRLRPDPGATAVAIGLDAAYHYYESVGQNWERAAMIKARPVAGDLGLGQTFLAGLAPFVWRKYFDFAAIADIHAMKRQIHAAKGHSEIAVAGHNVKLGRGGIREIEFFVQTQQLIFGGKRPKLRGSRTLPMLRQLRRDGWIGAHAVADLTRAYDFLRRTEHRLQMMNDAQTHRLPEAEDDLERFARFSGFANAARFAAVLTRHLRNVVHHYGRLFEGAPALDGPVGSLVFTGVDDDPETIETLIALGYQSPSLVAAAVRDWHSGRRAAVRTERERATLTDLVPKLLVTFAGGEDPDGAVAAFDKTLDRMRGAGELFAILSANASLRTLFGDILGSAPRLAAAVALRPHLLDGALDPSNAICLDEDEMEVRADAVRSRTATTETFLDAIRDFFHEEHFLIGVAVFSGELAVCEAGRAYSALAVAIVRVVLRQLALVFARDHGQVPESMFAVLALGKLGSREMTASSDLDLVFVYTFDQQQTISVGPRPLQATPYFTRLAQRLVSHLTVATRRGKLYEVDMRLRPSGRQGPLATKLLAFGSYQRTEAETWEHMALTRARGIAGPETIRERIRTEIAAILRMAPDADDEAGLDGKVAAMRDLIEREKPPRGPWDLKLLPGGLVDIEFIAQWLVLRHAHRHPELLDPSTPAILEIAERLGLLDREQGVRLREAHLLFSNATQIIRLALDEHQDPDDAGDGVRCRITTAAAATSFAHLVETVAEMRQAVRDIFRTLLSAG